MPIMTMTIQTGGHESDTIQPLMLCTQPRKKRKSGAVPPFMSRGRSRRRGKQNSQETWSVRA
ncbi:hypothetical protein BJI49_10795 [Acetobacter pasteurianus]|uniref:Uncharacterized protein n=1 Tax=Acetobacter malorum TaxID=178901 RepID=A0A149UN27_9PROT|nr:hypothetical protein AD951_07275 [Acetobacter malorum]RCL05384.1 hypothetical protein BJI49_10795 [Acetobacter pasteurianus]